MSADRTAILFFSHRPEQEWQNKRFVRQDYAKNRQVAEAFYQHTRQAVAESGFPVLEVTGAQQRGETFGGRLANAFADAFAAGYDRVIAVGNDCPALHEVDWTAVAAQLEEGIPVLGPTADGEGAYLIGLTQAQFDRQPFAALPWKTSELLAALRGHLAVGAGTSPKLLVSRDDVNGPADLRCLLGRSSAASVALIARLREALGDARHYGPSTRQHSSRSVLTRRSRAPPASLMGTRKG
jgi:glycosyltransferase A (GT-A) superfamily protein (DUF2064 family)